MTVSNVLLTNVVDVNTIYLAFNVTLYSSITDHTMHYIS